MRRQAKDFGTNALPSTLSALFRANSGSIMPIFVLCMTVTLGFIGLAVDFGVAYYDKSRMQSAADSAALIAVVTAKTAFQAIGPAPMPGTSTQGSIARQPGTEDDAIPNVAPIDPEAAAIAAEQIAATNGEQNPPVDGVQKPTAEPTTLFFSEDVDVVQPVETINSGPDDDPNSMIPGESSPEDPLDKAKAAASIVMRDAITHTVRMKDTQFTVDVERVGQDIKAVVSFDGTVTTSLSSFLGKDSVGVGLVSKAEASMPLFIDIHVLVDVSSSMGIGATPADLDIMRGAIGCTFGCHMSGTYQAARDAGATMRIDVVRDALARVIQASRDSPGASNVRFAVHTFSSQLHTVIPPTANMDQAAIAAGTIQLDRVGGGTNYHVALDALDELIPDSGDGSSDTSRKTYLIMLTDGVGDSARFTASGNLVDDPDFVEFPPMSNAHFRVQGFDPTTCSPLKNRGLDVFVMYMPYITSAGDPRYDFIENVLTPAGIAAQFSSCTSSAGNVYSASSREEIDRATDQIFSRIIEMPRLTQ
jgi:Putative Flp pilus-assembly TadE/G-like/von Willebrand factor type A domain